MIFWTKIKSIISIEKIGSIFRAKFSNSFNRVNSPTTKFIDKSKHVDQRQYNLTVNISSKDQKEERLVLNPEIKILLPTEKADHRIGEVDAEEEYKKVINKEIDEIVAIMNKQQFADARNKLLLLLGKLKDNDKFNNELVRIYNNLGVTYNQGDEQGNFEEAIKYFKSTLEIDPDFIKSKINLASALINSGKDENFEEGYNLICDIWKHTKNEQSLRVILWAVYKKEKSAQKVIDLVESSNDSEEIEKILNDNPIIKGLLANFYLEEYKYDKTLDLVNQALDKDEKEPEILLTKGKALMIKAQSEDRIPTEFDVIPKFKDFKRVRKALEIFQSVEKLAKNQNKNYLIPDIEYSTKTAMMWLGRYDEARHKFKTLKVPEGLEHNVKILNFADHLKQREFELALKDLKEDPHYDKIPYEEFLRVARNFIYYGAPEQALELLIEIEKTAEDRKDAFYWMNLSMVKVLLNNRNEAISAIEKAKAVNENKDAEKIIFSSYNSLMYRYAGQGGAGETDRLMKSTQEMQNKYPDEKILVPIKAIDDNGELTDEIKQIFLDRKDWYENIRETFKNNPIPLYHLEKVFNKSFIELITYTFSSDPNFTIELTAHSEEFNSELKNNLNDADGIIFDYLILIDLAKMDLLGLLEKLRKKIYIHEKLFFKIQDELLNFEVKELRDLWEFLRKSKKVIFISDECQDVELKSEKIDDIFEDWLSDSIRYSVKNKLCFATNDFRLYRFLKFEEIRPINILPIIKFLHSNSFIDDKMKSRAVADLAERYYIFISYNAEDLFEAVIEDDGQITGRTYHLVNQINLSGSDLRSFTDVFAKFLYKFWRTGSLPAEKVNWLKFFTETINNVVEKEIESVKKDPTLITEIQSRLGEPISHFTIMWKMAINNGNLDDLTELRKITDSVLNKEYLAQSKQMLEQKIDDRIKELNKK